MHCRYKSRTLSFVPFLSRCKCLLCLWRMGFAYVWPFSLFLFGYICLFAKNYSSTTSRPDFPSPDFPAGSCWSPPKLCRTTFVLSVCDRKDEKAELVCEEPQPMHSAPIHPPHQHNAHMHMCLTNRTNAKKISLHFQQAANTYIV